MKQDQANRKAPARERRHSPLPTVNLTPSSTPANIQPSPGTRLLPVSQSSPTGPTPRANPFPEVTDLTCRLPLPTLVYRQEAVHLGDLLRISVRPGTKFVRPLSSFQGSTAIRSDPARTAGLFGLKQTSSLSPREAIPGIRALIQNRELCPGRRPTSPSLATLRCRS